MQDLTGHGLAYHKEPWRMLAWAYLNDSLKMVYSTKERIVLEDQRECVSVIEFLGPDKPVTALGFTMSLDGDQKHQLKVPKEKIKEFCQKN